MSVKKLHKHESSTNLIILYCHCCCGCGYIDFLCPLFLLVCRLLWKLVSEHKVNKKCIFLNDFPRLSFIPYTVFFHVCFFFFGSFFLSLSLHLAWSHSPQIFMVYCTAPPSIYRRHRFFLCLFPNIIKKHRKKKYHAQLGKSKSIRHGKEKQIETHWR